jgi:YidC/Oxa1 family membrane protein insertase
MNINKQDNQKRILLATGLFFIFFVAYDFLYLKPQQEAYKEKMDQEQKSQTVQADLNKAPKTSVAPATKAIPQTTQNSVEKKDVLTTIKTAKNIISIDHLGRIAQVELTGDIYNDEDGENIKLLDSSKLRPLEVRFVDPNQNIEAFTSRYTTSETNIDATTTSQVVTLTQKLLNNTTLTKKITFYPEGHYDLEVVSSSKDHFFITAGFRPDVIADMYADHGVLMKLNDNTLNIVEDGDLSQTQNFIGIKAVSSFDRYYATVLHNINDSFEVALMPDNEGNPQSFVKVDEKIKLGGYIGPKEYNALYAISPELTDVIEYGWFTFLAKPMFTFLQYIYNIVGNWGWTIIILTILVKLVLYPLSYKGMVSMNRLKELAPKMKDIQEKYKDDKQKASMHMMELYKKHKVNPLGGCLPLVLQIPVFFAIYRVLINAIELKGAEWILWINDLAEMDPFFVLPILMGITMYIQQKITPNTMQDEMQRKMFEMLPIFFTFIFLWFPAGLTLYWFINNLLTIAQQYSINKIFESKKENKK